MLPPMHMSPSAQYAHDTYAASLMPPPAAIPPTSPHYPNFSAPQPPVWDTANPSNTAPPSSPATVSRPGSAANPSGRLRRLPPCAPLLHPQVPISVFCLLRYLFVDCGRTLGAGVIVVLLFSFPAARMSQGSHSGSGAGDRPSNRTSNHSLPKVRRPGVGAAKERRGRFLQVH